RIQLHCGPAPHPSCIQTHNALRRIPNEPPDTTSDAPDLAKLRKESSLQGFPGIDQSGFIGHNELFSKFCRCRCNPLKRHAIYEYSEFAFGNSFKCLDPMEASAGFPTCDLQKCVQCWNR